MAEASTETTTEETTTTETTEQATEQQQLELSKETSTTTSVTSAEHAKVLERLRLAEAQVETNKDAAKTAELKTLQEQNKWQEIAELKEAEAVTANEKLANISKAMIRKEKYSSIHLEAQKLGMRPEAARLVELMEFDNVLVETTTLGNINVVGAAEAAAALKLESPFMFGKSTANLNTNSPDVTLSGNVTIDIVMKARAKWKQSNDPADFATFEKLNRKYLELKND